MKIQKVNIKGNPMNEFWPLFMKEYRGYSAEWKPSGRKYKVKGLHGLLRSPEVLVQMNGEMKDVEAYLQKEEDRIEKTEYIKSEKSKKHTFIYDGEKDCFYFSDRRPFEINSEDILSYCKQKQIEPVFVPYIDSMAQMQRYQRILEKIV